MLIQDLTRQASLEMLARIDRLGGVGMVQPVADRRQMAEVLSLGDGRHGGGVGIERTVNRGLYEGSATGEYETRDPVHLHRNSFELTNVNGKATGGILKDVVLVKGSLGSRMAVVIEALKALGAGS